MSYTVLARRYRSQGFEEVIGQEPIARTLQRAIQINRVAHAYLFCGTRGVGKTSMARIFARALNISDDLTDKDAIVNAIMRGEDIDVIEIDGASNNKVEEARDLISNSIYRPARCQYKIYIIDEVHMLTTNAFNALLKTMEEPPEHVKFILCTTEPHKIPATIQSRCQRFDFRSIPTRRIADHLSAILEQEELKADERVIQQIARLANGSMRDGLSLLDRLIASGESHLTDELLEEMFGLPDRDLIQRLINAFAQANPADALQVSHDLSSRGVSHDQIIEVLVEHLRTLMIVAACNGAPSEEVLDVPADDLPELVVSAARFDVVMLTHMIVLLENLQRSMKFSSIGRALFDAVLVRLTLGNEFTNTTAMMHSASTSTKKKTDNRSLIHTEQSTPSQKVTRSAPTTTTLSRAKTTVPKPNTTQSTAVSADKISTSQDIKSVWSQVCDEVDSNHDQIAIASIVEHLSPVELTQDHIRLRLHDETLRLHTMRNLERVATIVSKFTGYPVKAVLLQADNKPPDALEHSEQHTDRALDTTAVGSHDGASNTAADPRNNKPSKVNVGNRITKEDRQAALKIPLVRKAMELLDAKITNIEPNK